MLKLLGSLYEWSKRYGSLEISPIRCICSFSFYYGTECRDNLTLSYKHIYYSSQNEMQVLPGKNSNRNAIQKEFNSQSINTPGQGRRCYLYGLKKEVYCNTTLTTRWPIRFKLEEENATKYKVQIQSSHLWSLGPINKARMNYLFLSRWRVTILVPHWYYRYIFPGYGKVASRVWIFLWVVITVWTLCLLVCCWWLGGIGVVSLFWWDGSSAGITGDWLVTDKTVAQLLGDLIRHKYTR